MSEVEYGISENNSAQGSARFRGVTVCNAAVFPKNLQDSLIFAEPVFAGRHAVGLQEHPVKVALVFIADRLYDFGDAHIRGAQQPFCCFQTFVSEKFAEGLPENFMDAPRNVFAAVA